MTVRWQQRTRGMCAVLVAMWLVGCGADERAAEAPLPEIPEFESGTFLRVIAEQLDAARARLMQTPYDPAANGELAMMLAAYDQDGPAADLFERAHRLAPSEFRWPYYLGYARYDLHQLPEAIAAMRSASKIRPEHANARIRLAEYLFEDGQYESSRALFEDITEAFPGRLEGHLGLGKLANRNNDAEAAIAHLRRALAIESRIGEIHFALAEAYRKLGDTETAARHLALFEKYRGNRPNPRDSELLAIGAMNVGDLPHVSRAMSHLRGGRVVEAARAYRSAVEINPANVVALSGLMEIHGRAKELEVARGYFRRALDANPANAELHARWAEVLRINGQLNEAMDSYRQAIDMDSFNAAFVAGLGRTMQDAGKLEEAEKQYRRALDLDPASADATYALAYLLAMRQDNRQAAALLVPLVEEADTPRPGVLQLLARVEAQSGEFGQALERLGRARAQLLGGQNPRLLAQIEADIRAVEAARAQAEQ